MIAKDVDHVSHGMFPYATSTGISLMIILVRRLFVPYFSLIGGVHAPHEMVPAPMERLALSEKPGVFLFCEGYG